MPFQFKGFFFIKWELKSYAKIRTWKIFMLHSNLGGTCSGLTVSD